VEAAGSGRIAGFDPILVRDAGGRLLDRFVAGLTELLPAGDSAPLDEQLPLDEHQPHAERQSPGASRSPGESGSHGESTRTQRPAAEPPLATVTSIAGAVAVRSRARRAAASAALLLVGILTLWLTRRRGN
jgi:hypothetical protein